jgi:hypothetical protein
MSPYSSVELMCSPVYSRPFVYEIPDDAYANGFGRYTVSLLPTSEEAHTDPRSSFSCSKEHITQCSCPTVEDLDMAAPPRFK